MSVRLIAQDLYRIIREVEKLEKELLAAPAQNHEILKERLRKAKAERDLMRRSLEGRRFLTTYPFTAPIVRPLTTYFWKIMVKIIAGVMIATAAAITPPQSTSA